MLTVENIGYVQAHIYIVGVAGALILFFAIAAWIADIMAARHASRFRRAIAKDAKQRAKQRARYMANIKSRHLARMAKSRSNRLRIYG